MTGPWPELVGLQLLRNCCYEATCGHPAKTVKIAQSDPHHGADCTPYEGLEITGWPVATMLRGRFIVRDGELLGGKGERPTSHAASRGA